MSPFPTLSVSQVSRAESVRPPPQHTQPLQLSSSQPTQPPRTPVLVYDEENAFYDDDDDDAAAASGSDNTGSDSDDTAAVGVIPFLTPPDCVVPRHPSPPRDEEEAAEAAASAAAAPAPSKVGLTRSSLSASTMSLVLSPDSCRGSGGGLADAQQQRQKEHAGVEADMADADAGADADLCVEQPLPDVHATPVLPGARWWRTTTTAAAAAVPPPLPPVETAPESRDFAAAEDEEDEEISATPPCLVAPQGNRSQTTDDSESTPVVLSQLPVPPPPSEQPSERPLPTPPVLAVAEGAAASDPPSSCRTPGCTTPDVKKVLSYTANWTYSSAAGAAAAATDAPPSAARRPFGTPFPPLNYDALVAEERTFVEETPPPQSLRITRPVLDRYRAGFSLKRETALQAYGAENTYILARDAGEEGAKMFCALPRHLVKDLVLSDELATRCYYAVVPPDVPVDAYIDVDLKLAQLPELCGGAIPACAADARAFRYGLLEAVLRRLAAALARAEVSPQTIVALEATTEKKVSFHVHCTLQGAHAFANTTELQCFLKAAYSRGGAAAATADSAGESEDALLDRLACEAVDFAPYSRFCCFRLPFCAKMGRSNHLAVLRPEEVVTCPDLAALLAAHAPDRYVATLTDVLDLCLISKPACKQVKHVAGFARLSGGSSVSSTSTGTAGAAARPPRRAGLSASAHAPSGCLELPAGSETAVMADLLAVFRQLSPHYEGLCAGDLRVKRLTTTYKVSQGRTKWCNQVGRLHTSSTTHYTLSSTHISVQCWSPKCVRQAVQAAAEIPHLRTPGVLERLFPDVHKQH